MRGFPCPIGRRIVDIVQVGVDPTWWRLLESAACVSLCEDREVRSFPRSLGRRIVEVGQVGGVDPVRWRLRGSAAYISRCGNKEVKS